MVRTVFEESTVQVLEEAFKPIPPQVGEWFKQVNWLSWRATVQANRKMSDTDFIRRFLPTVPTGATLAEPGLMPSHGSLQPVNLVSEFGYSTIQQQGCMTWPIRRLICITSINMMRMTRDGCSHFLVEPICRPNNS